MSLLGRHFWKFFFGLLAIVVFGFAVIYGADYYSNYKIYQQQKAAIDGQR
ncbi:MAG: hypothetical protein Q8Q46_02225 [Candidatus Giovannonibacteria bacterium]|nr:hypothetical protein [Candidatus Giovannonibacteria bacterium]